VAKDLSGGMCARGKDGWGKGLISGVGNWGKWGLWGMEGLGLIGFVFLGSEGRYSCVILFGVRG